ncbi:MAG: SpoIIE family protein phosphatase [Candidatus Polarisedimenticolia bacterium]
METVGNAMLEWGLASLALAPELESGDLHVVRSFADGSLVAVVDGLGHGPEAAAAARRCATLLVQHAERPLEQLVTRCHEGLRGTRGVSLAAASFDAKGSTMSWLGVGNVSAILVPAARDHALRRCEFMLQRNGVVGLRLPNLIASTLPVQTGDTLILATDGIRQDFSMDVNPADRPQQLADRVLARHIKTTDDALVLVVRYRGSAP